MFLLKLAFLNIGRNPRRSLITVLAVGVGLAALIFLWGFSDGTNNQMRENVIQLLTGHIQIHATDFERTLAPELTIPERSQVLEQLKSIRSIQTVTERIKCEALIGTSEKSRGVLLTGIDPTGEKQVTSLADHIQEGEFLSPEDTRKMMIGDRLAKKIQIALGDKVVVMTQAMDGTLSGYAYQVKGIFHTGSQAIDEVSAYITLSSARELLSLENNTHEIVIKLSGRKTISSVLDQIRAKLDLNQYEILTWNQIMPEIEQWVAWSEAIIRTILLAVMVVIGVSIMNTVLMSVLERTRELGVMMAIGTTPKQIVSLILLETLILEFFGILLGLAGGYAVTAYFGKVGIAFPELEKAFSKSYMSTITYTQVEAFHVVQSIIVLILLTTFIGLYPAWKAGRMQPIKAIYRP
ncbi:MAG: ABC transporter permease [Candidatus Omnitrophica bacterium]|nr:ABC transporter permease [Candidatus Omnitrophota bacterium]